MAFLTFPVSTENIFKALARSRSLGVAAVKLIKGLEQLITLDRLCKAGRAAMQSSKSGFALNGITRLPNNRPLGLYLDEA